MKGSEVFKSTINAYLQGRAVSDPLFSETLKKPKKNIDDCITYIMNEVKKTGCNGFADEEIFGMAVHYYDEDNIKVGNKITSGHVVVNHSPEPITVASKAKNQKPSKPVKKVEAKKEQPSNVLTLF